MEKEMFIRHTFFFKVETNCTTETEGQQLLNPIIDKIDNFCNLFGATFSKEYFWSKYDETHPVGYCLVGYNIYLFRRGVFGEIRAYSDATRAFCEFNDFPRPKETIELVTKVTE